MGSFCVPMFLRRFAHALWDTVMFMYSSETTFIHKQVETLSVTRSITSLKDNQCAMSNLQTKQACQYLSHYSCIRGVTCYLMVKRLTRWRNRTRVFCFPDHLLSPHIKILVGISTL